MRNQLSVRVYLDESIYRKLLVSLLRQEGYQVCTPAEAGLLGASDDAQLAFAAAHEYMLLTKDTDDFRVLHDEWIRKGRRHSGIILICDERDFRKNMTYHDIVQAIGIWFRRVSR